VKQERILGTGGFVERVLSESEEPAGQDPANSLKDSGAIDKGVTYRLGPGGAVIGCFYVCHFYDFA